MSQTIRLASDNADWPDVWSKVGGSGSFASCLASNDGDTSYISKSGNIANSGSPAMKFSTFTRPTTDSGWSLSLVGKTTSSVIVGGGAIYQGDPASGGSLVCNITGLSNFNNLVYSTQTYSLSSGEAALITDPTDLYYLANMAGSAVTLRYTDIYLTVPDDSTVTSCLIPMMGAG